MNDASSRPLRVMVGYDGSDAADAAIAAVAALLPGARVLVLHARSEPMTLEHAALARMAIPEAVAAAAVEAHEQEHQRHADEVASRGGAVAIAAGLDATSATQAGSSAWRVICRTAAEQSVDVVACGSRGRGELASMALGSTSSSVLHNTDRPTLVVPAVEFRAAGPLVVAYDGSDGAKAAIRETARLFGDRHAIVAHAWSSPVRRTFSGAGLLAAPVPEVRATARDLDEFFADEAQEVAEDGAAFARECGLVAESLLVEAAPGAWRALLAAAGKRGASLVVAGSRGRGALAATVLGSTSSGLAQNADRPVLIIRS